MYVHQTFAFSIVGGRSDVGVSISRVLRAQGCPVEAYKTINYSAEQTVTFRFTSYREFVKYHYRIQ